MLEQKLKVLEKQVKAQTSQHNRRNIVNKLEKEKNGAQTSSSTTKETYSSQERIKGKH
jgi:hypothetical protein